MSKTEDAAGTSSDERGVTTTVVETEIEAVTASLGERKDHGETSQTLAGVEGAETSMNLRAESVSLEEDMAMVVVTGALLLREWGEEIG